MVILINFGGACLSLSQIVVLHPAYRGLSLLVVCSFFDIVWYDFDELS